MPEIPDDAMGGSFFKASNWDPELKLGERKTFIITGPHTTGGKADNTLYSIPVKHEGKEGSFGLNKSNMKTLVKALGKNSDTWAGAKFDGVVILQNNPSKGNEKTKSFIIDPDTIISPKKR